MAPGSTGSGSNKRSRSVSSTSRKKPKSSSLNGPSAQASNQIGMVETDARLRSVLCNPLGLPLLLNFHEDDGVVENLSSIGLAKKRVDVAQEDKSKLDRLLSGCLGRWKQLKGATKSLKQDATKTSKQNEPSLTKMAADEINKISKASQFLSFTAKNDDTGYMDILLRGASNEGTPLAVIEFGLDNNDWWKKLHQGVQYLDLMASSQLKDETLSFKQKEPVLLVCFTLIKSEKDGEAKTAEAKANETSKVEDVFFKLGVFLCCRRGPNKGTTSRFRMSLLWFKQGQEEDVSEAFGRVLRVTLDFQKWRNATTPPVYEYLGPNCCKVKSSDGYAVLRSYDDRVRASSRSAALYLDEEAKSIFCSDGESLAKTLVDFNAPGLDGTRKNIKIIQTPYREGEHCAQHPKQFIPIIRQLKALHEKNLVHGDIRAFNTVFGEEEQDGEYKGWLIDLDFGGKAGEACYPKGYINNLVDGVRMGEPTKPITKEQDWFALRQLMFMIHEFDFIDLLEDDAKRGKLAREQRAIKDALEFDKDDDEAEKDAEDSKADKFLTEFDFNRLLDSLWSCQTIA